MLEPICAGCVWYDKKNDACDVNGQCVRKPRNAPPVPPDEYQLFPDDEITRLRRLYEYELRQEE